MIFVQTETLVSHLERKRRFFVGMAIAAAMAIPTKNLRLRSRCDTSVSVCTKIMVSPFASSPTSRLARVAHHRRSHFLRRFAVAMVVGGETTTVLTSRPPATMTNLSSSGGTPGMFVICPPVQSALTK